MAVAGGVSALEACAPRLRCVASSCAIRSGGLISAARATGKIDAALLGKVEDALKRAGLPYQDAFLDDTSAKIRFADTDTQLKAKDLIEREVGQDYTVALNLLSNAPSWLTAIGAKPMYLGLDLRGGVHFLLQVDMAG